MIGTACRKYLVDLAWKHARENRLALSTLGRRVHGSLDFFEDFKAGRCSVTLKKYDEIVAEFGGSVDDFLASVKTTVKKKRKT